MDLSNVNDRGNVSDERGGGRKKLMVGGGIGGLIIVVLGALGILSPDMQKFLQGLVANQQAAQPADGEGEGKPPQDGAKEFSEKVLGSSNAVWREQFRKEYGKEYKEPMMRLFEGDIDTGCGRANSGIGPFYCPADQKVYLDPSFFDQLERQLKGSAKDFSKAYVITHEVGHHVQNLLGYNARVKEYERREGENAGIRLELQADYLAGVWAHHADRKYRVIEAGDVEAAFTSAKAIGDDTLQKRGRGTVNPESFDHGTSAQRMAFFRAGLESGDAGKRALDHFFDERVRPLDLKPR
jgi:uncharacterized protein